MTRDYGREVVNDSVGEVVYYSWKQVRDYGCNVFRDRVSLYNTLQRDKLLMYLALRGISIWSNRSTANE